MQKRDLNRTDGGTLKQMLKRTYENSRSTLKQTQLCTERQKKDLKSYAKAAKAGPKAAVSGTFQHKQEGTFKQMHQRILKKDLTVFERRKSES